MPTQMKDRSGSVQFGTSRTVAIPSRKGRIFLTLQNDEAAGGSVASLRTEDPRNDNGAGIELDPRAALVVDGRAAEMGKTVIGTGAGTLNYYEVWEE